MPEQKCHYNIDPLKLIREGTSQEQRPFPALDPAYAPVNERTPGHGMVFAQALSSFLRYYETNNIPVGTWQRFFGQDVSVQLAIAAVQDVDEYRQNVKEYFDFLNDILHDAALFESACKNQLGYLFSCIGTLAVRLDTMLHLLPDEFPLKATLQNAVNSQLAPHFSRFWGYYKHDFSLAIANRLIADVGAVASLPSVALTILGGPAIPIGEAKAHLYSKDWIPAGAISTDWAAHYSLIAPINEYGVGSVFTKINRLSTHNLFMAVFDQFLKTYARVVSDAKLALENSFTNYNRHEPHYTLFLAFLRLHEYARDEANTLTGRHLDYYYKEILRLKEKPAEPGHAHLLVELAKHAETHEIESGALFKAGKDGLGKDAFFANDRTFIANKAKVAALKTLHRHGDENVGTDANKDKQNGRLYASPVANSDDGLGGALTSTDQSWHPFYNKIYVDGALDNIHMPTTEVGFVVASHYLWMAEGERWVWAELNVGGYTGATFEEFKNSFVCALTTEKGWVEKTPYLFIPFTTTKFWLLIGLDGQDDAITGYNAKTHGYAFQTDLPVLLVRLKQETSSLYIYPKFQHLTLTSINLQVFVFGLKSLAVSNDFGPVDTSKPFQPFGASPIQGSAMVVGSKEIFQKNLTTATLIMEWQNPPLPFGGAAPLVIVDFLKGGTWLSSGIASMAVGNQVFPLSSGLALSVVNQPDLTENEFYNTGSKHGFARFKLSRDFGQAAYQAKLLSYVRKDPSATDPGSPPAGPFAALLSMQYSALQTITLDSANAEQFNHRPAKFLHLLPFGHAEQHPYLKTTAPDKAIYLLPQLKHLNSNDPLIPKGEAVAHESEFYIGVTGLNPPQNLALLFQVADGTADPLSTKPDPHLYWSYLRENEWVDFSKDQVEDQTDELLKSGIVTLAVPRDASSGNTLLPPGTHWIRMAVAKESDTVCRLLMVAAQALNATFANRSNDPTFPAKILEAGTISKLDRPDAAVKKIEQPFAAFGGRGEEASLDFYTRISERLRHKDRSIALWDYERLVLEAFPQLYKAKCLNHTKYEPNESGSGIYRELAAGHVTFVTIPNQQFINLRDPLKPYTSLGLLSEVETFLKKRLSCFVKLHVKNPQFEEVNVDFRVKLYEGFDESFYEKKLKQEITRFLSPWAYPGGGSPTFGGKIYKSVLINFIEDRPYVDYVTDFKLFHTYTDFSTTPPKQVTQGDLNEVEGSTAVSILVSVPESKHTIFILTQAEEESLSEKCPCEA